MNKLYIFLCGLLFTTACTNDLDQFPENLAAADTLTDYEPVLNAAYYYQIGSVTPMAVMGDFRADNALMIEPPFTEFDEFDGDLVVMEDQFFGPFYTALYKSILSANNVIENSDDATEVGEAKFLRALSYFKLVRAFGDATINTSAQPDFNDLESFGRSPESEVYDNVIIPDLEDAIAALDNETRNGRATRIAARGMLGKVHMQRGNTGRAEPVLAEVIANADDAGVMLQENYADIFGVTNDLNPEIMFATQISSSIVDEYDFSEFWSWYGGLDTKSLEPLDPDLVEAFDESPGDLRREVVIDTALMASPKYPQSGGPDHDWIELRYADILLLYAEALNENGTDAATVLDVLDPIRTRAGLEPLDEGAFDSSDDIAEAIQDERRLELAFEGQRWFDLVRTGTVNEEMGQDINSNYYIFPIPNSEVLSSFGSIEQNPGY